VEEARKTAEERHQEGRCALTDELEQVKDELKQVKGDLTIKCTELSFANEDIKGLESQLQQLAQSSSDNLALPLPAAAPAPAGDKDVEGGGADQGPVSELALPKVGKTVGLGFTFKRDSRSGNWQVSPAPLPSVPPSLPPLQRHVVRVCHACMRVLRPTCVSACVSFEYGTMCVGRGKRSSIPQVNRIKEGGFAPTCPQIAPGLILLPGFRVLGLGLILTLS